jgi:hypothetical protein
MVASAFRSCRSLQNEHSYRMVHALLEPLMTLQNIGNNIAVLSPAVELTPHCSRDFGILLRTLPMPA